MSIYSIFTCLAANHSPDLCWNLFRLLASPLPSRLKWQRGEEAWSLTGNVTQVQGEGVGVGTHMWLWCVQHVPKWLCQISKGRRNGSKRQRSRWRYMCLKASFGGLATVTWALSAIAHLTANISTERLQFSHPYSLSRCVLHTFLA